MKRFADDKCLLPAFCSFPTIFSNFSLSSLLKTQDVWLSNINPVISYTEKEAWTKENRSFKEANQSICGQKKDMARNGNTDRQNSFS